jgi:hypothetical protein
MAATVEIDESNGAGETVTHGIANSNLGAVDAADLDPVANPIAPGANSYEKWQKIHVSAMGGSSAIDTLKVWRTGSLGNGTGTAHVTNARESGYTPATYATPTASASTVATQNVPTGEPAGANLGIGGSLSGQLTGAGSSDYLVHQVQVAGDATAGATTTMHYQYDETA